MRRLLVGALVAATAASACRGHVERRTLGSGPARHDAIAQSEATRLLDQIEACFAETRNYENCDTPDERAVIGRVPVSAGVAVRDASRDSFVIVASSEAGGTFEIRRTPSGVTLRSCTHPSTGLCDANGSW